jgi:hypothetical protein
LTIFAFISHLSAINLCIVRARILDGGGFEAEYGSVGGGEFEVEITADATKSSGAVALGVC